MPAPLTQTTGRRKQAVGRIRLRPCAGETGSVTVNGRTFEDYFLTRDSRKKESKKYGLKKARKAPQYSKR